MSTLDVVADVLREVAPRALKAREIAARAGARLPTSSKTPETVVSRDLAIDVRDRGSASRFLRVDRGAFVLKEALPTALYNDVEPFAAQWTRNLISAGELAPGVVDERSIRDLKPADVAGYRQFHAFSGIGIWSRALRDAGFPDDANIWSGSCPCNPFSQAGQKRGFEDERHLWPEWFRLISACRPSIVVGEQVASKDGLAWLDAVFVNLEGADYTVRAIDSCAAGYGAPHIRQRLYFAAVARERGREILGAPWLHDRGKSRNDAAGRRAVDGGTPVALSDAASARCETAQDDGADRGDARTRSETGEWWATWGLESQRDGEADGAGGNGSALGELGDAGSDGAREHGRELPGDEAQHEERSTHGDHAPLTASETYRPGDRVRIASDPSWGGAVGGFWARDVEWIYCRPAPGHEDGCFRPAESGTQPLALRTASDLGRTRAKRLRGYGNAIVLPQATVFVEEVIGALIDDRDRLAALEESAS